MLPIRKRLVHAGNHCFNIKQNVQDFHYGQYLPFDVGEVGYKI